MRLNGGVGCKVSSGDTPEKGWPLARERLEQRTGRRAGLEEPQEINTSREPQAERMVRDAGRERGEDRARDAEAAPVAGRPPEWRLGVRGGQCAERGTTERGGGEVGGACLWAEQRPAEPVQPNPSFPAPQADLLGSLPPPTSALLLPDHRAVPRPSHFLPPSQQPAPSSEVSSSSQRLPGKLEPSCISGGNLKWASL